MRLAPPLRDPNPPDFNVPDGNFIYFQAKSSRGFQTSSPADREKQAEIAFRMYDKDKDGFITKAEFEKMSKNLNKDKIDKVNPKSSQFTNDMYFST